MNKTAGILLGVIIVLILGGLIFYVANTNMSQTSLTATSTPDTTTNVTANQNQTSTPQAGTPLVQTSSNANPTDTTVVVSGQITPNGAFTNYWFEYGTTANLGNKTANQMVGSGFLSIPTPAYITNLSKDTTYYFRLVAQNQYGTTAGAQYTFQTTHGVPAPVGSAPKAITVSANGISRSTASLKGTVNPDQNETSYWFEYGTTPDLGNASALTSVGNGTANTAVSLSLSNLDPATTYYFRINAENQFGTINGSILNFKTLGPVSPTIPGVTTRNASGVGTSVSTLNGTVSPNGADTTYWFEYSTDSLLGSVLLQSTPQAIVPGGANQTSVSADLSNLDSGTTYYFRLVAQNSQGTVRGDRLSFKTQ